MYIQCKANSKCYALGYAKVSVKANVLDDALTVIALWIGQAFECPFWIYILLFYEYFTYLQVF